MSAAGQKDTGAEKSNVLPMNLKRFMTVDSTPPRMKRKWPSFAPPFRSPAAGFPGVPAAAEGERVIMAFSAPAAYLTHQQKVLRLYKRALRHLESWCIHRDKYRYFACLMRARFEEHKNEKDMVKATQLLKEAEEEFWYNQHPQPYIFPDSPGGTSYERYECYKVPEWCLDDWHPSEKAMYPDYFAKREQWKKLRMESWEREQY
ncbi:NADH dehydrogenase [ubiquinone] 1 beta subcomplex subunit 9 isoform X2 [Choloepus didactylus]|uniref:NADH dehydrogenase [ubiquinone] 1 beta subcomplex subunit 9 isoform X2 n=1 Tax=Choloepus didactylus TaxID=27675 RepID=UPI00189E56D3|nr:NADH dehydrogenase [ubiquinone] 1 beta subcomplex subunit 9 isoform X2 [Choloepus didactylus]